MPLRRWALSPSSSCLSFCKLDFIEFTPVPGVPHDWHSGSYVFCFPLLGYTCENILDLFYLQVADALHLLLSG